MSNQFEISVPKLSPTYVLQTMSEVYDWGLRDLNIPDIHKKTMGEGITIAVIDSGKSEHFELVNNTIGAKNFSDSKEVEDRNGHSTVVSGIIAAEKNYQGIIGVAPKSKIYFIKAIDDAGRGGPAQLVQSIDWAINQKVDIISISAGMFVDFKPLHVVVKRAYNENIVIISAAGNSGTRHYDVAFPARYPEVIGVAAYDTKHKIAPFSSRGINVSFSMPGVDIYSTYLDNNYCTMSGTSFSAPLLSGICALILAKHRQLGSSSKTPCETPQQMLEHLVKYAIKLESGQNASGFGTIDIKSMFALDEPDHLPMPAIKPVTRASPFTLVKKSRRRVRPSTRWWTAYRRKMRIRRRR